MSERELFEAALERPPAERGPFLDGACRGDAALRGRVEALLGRHAEADNHREGPAPAEGRTGLYLPVTERPGMVVGPYKLLQQIGEGGFGVVYMAEQERPVRRMVALKIIKPGMDTAQVIARFESERQALALMDHPNIARVLDAGATDSGRPYFVMELVKGVPITAFCDKNHMAPEQRLQLFIDVCHAIQHAHHKGVIHRDVKPSNVMVTLHDGVPVVKVIDFGVAKATAQKLTERTLFTAYGQMVGTPAYMSPEQAEMSGLDIDTRSDIYSLGVLLYELLTGTTPLESKRLREAGFAEMQRLIREEEAPRPSTRLSSLGGSATVLAGNRGTDPKQLVRLLAGDLDWIVMKALEKDRNRRYATPGNFAEDVERYLRHEAILARPPSTAYKLRKFAQRNRATVVTAALVLLALAGGTVGTTVGMIRAGRAERGAAADRDRAERERDAAVEARKETFDALIDLSDRTVGDLLSRQSAASAVSPGEREFFGRVVARFERLAATLPDAAEGQAMRARCLSAVGDAYLYLGDHNQALDAYRRAIDLYRGLRDRSPDDPGVTRLLLRCRAQVVVAYDRLKRSEEANRALAEALALAEEAHRRFPEDGGITLSLGLLYSNRALERWNDPAARLADVNRAIDLAQGEVNRGQKGAGLYLAKLLSRRAAHFRDLGDVEGVRADTARVEQLSAAGKTVSLTLVHCTCMDSLGQALVRAKRPEAAVAAYRNAVRELERLAGWYPGSVDIRSELVRCYDALRRPLRDVGRAEEADRYQRQAAALLERAVRPGSESAALYGELAERAAALAESTRAAGRTEEAADALGRAVKYGRRLVEVSRAAKPPDTPAERADRLRQAWRCRAVGHAAEKQNRWAEAIEFGRRQLELTREAAVPGSRPGPEPFNLLLAGNLGLTIALTAAGRSDEALAAWEETLRLVAWSEPGGINDGVCEQLARLQGKLTEAGKVADPAAVLAPGLAERRAKLTAEPAAAQVRLDLRRGYRVLGLVYEKSGRFAAARGAFEQVVGVAPVPPDGPDSRVKAERHLVVGAHIGRAICLDALGQPAHAEAAWRASCELTGNSPEAYYGMRVINLARNGQPERAVQMAEEKRRRSDSGPERYNAACVYATASASAALAPARKEELARRAVALLGEAQAVGYFDEPKQVAHAKADGDLDPLRGREDFKALLATLGAIKGKGKERPGP